ncbi:hypothetical protein EDB81DRAFT_65645 [Dactylonectria macrodidyma]|uniref:Uncharacterized protein n=1 Tax=Dactylonectria macrodidyma TaxID=307937 RepID=A0A9P9IYT5_9HYPO|nr:hypothetical protein EDB81DRAFT_65645 [Dactylonectria macrodidyma]
MMDGRIKKRVCILPWSVGSSLSRWASLTLFFPWCWAGARRRGNRILVAVPSSVGAVAVGRSGALIGFLTAPPAQPARETPKMALPWRESGLAHCLPFGTCAFYTIRQTLTTGNNRSSSIVSSRPSLMLFLISDADESEKRYSRLLALLFVLFLDFSWRAAACIVFCRTLLLDLHLTHPSV